MYMIDTSGAVEFEWDNANKDKSLIKHGITPNEAEEIFLDENAFLQEDIKHSQQEKRFIIIGKTFEKKVLFCIFTVRNYKLRIISVRRADKQEKKLYEKT
jgi:uncharacterized protein